MIKKTHYFDYVVVKNISFYQLLIQGSITTLVPSFSLAKKKKKKKSRVKKKKTREKKRNFNVHID